mgnify:CR=1 FL=1
MARDCKNPEKPRPDFRGGGVNRPIGRPFFKSMSICGTGNSTITRRPSPFTKDRAAAMKGPIFVAVILTI